MAGQRERAAVRRAAVAFLLRIFPRCLQNQQYHKTFTFVWFLLLFLLVFFCIPLFLWDLRLFLQV